MTRKDFKKIFDNEKNLEVRDNSIQGLLIISKYVNGDVVCGAEHDIIYSVHVDVIVDAITVEDATQLAHLNWIIDNDCLAYFV